MSEDHCSAISGRMSEDARVTRAREWAVGQWAPGYTAEMILQDVLRAYGARSFELAELRRERDELRADVKGLTRLAAVWGERVLSTEAERDALRATVTRLRALADEHDRGRGQCVCPLCDALTQIDPQ